MSHDNGVCLDALLSENRTILKEIYQRNLPRVHRYMKHNNGDGEDADDVLQHALEVMLQLAVRRGKDFLTVPFDSYLLGIVRHTWLKELARRKKMTNLDENNSSERVINDDESALQVEDTSENFAIANIEQQIIENETISERNKNLWNKFNQLPDYCQKLLKLRIIDGLSNPKIAEREDFTLAYVTSRISTCLTRLREMF